MLTEPTEDTGGPPRQTALRHLLSDPFHSRAQDPTGKCKSGALQGRESRWVQVVGKVSK